MSLPNFDRRLDPEPDDAPPCPSAACDCPGCSLVCATCDAPLGEWATDTEAHRLNGQWLCGDCFHAQPSVQAALLHDQREAS